MPQEGQVYLNSEEKAMIGTNRKKHIKTRIIILTAVILLNLIGISYAWMEDSLQMVMRFFTGSMGISFSEEYTADSGLTVHFEDNNRVMVIEGSVDIPIVQAFTEAGEGDQLNPQYPGYEGYLFFQLINTATIPVKLVGHSYTDKEPITFDSSALPNELMSGESSSQQKLIIKAEPGSYEFEIELLYSH